MGAIPQPKFSIQELENVSNRMILDEKISNDDKNSQVNNIHPNIYSTNVQNVMNAIASLEKDQMSIQFQSLLLDKLPENLKVDEKVLLNDNQIDNFENPSDSTKEMNLNIYFENTISSFSVRQTISKKNYNTFMQTELQKRANETKDYLNSFNYSTEELSELARLVEYIQEL